MAQEGNTATDLGPSTIDRVAVEGYAVHLDAATLKADIAKDDLPAWMQEAVASVSNPNVDYKVYIDGSGRLVRLTTETTATATATAMASGLSVSEGISMDFAEYGATVDVAAPPASDVVSFQSFLQQAAGIPLWLIQHDESVLHASAGLPVGDERVRSAVS